MKAVVAKKQAITNKMQQAQPKLDASLKDVQADIKQAKSEMKDIANKQVAKAKEDIRRAIDEDIKPMVAAVKQDIQKAEKSVSEKIKGVLTDNMVVGQEQMKKLQDKTAAMVQRVAKDIESKIEHKLKVQELRKVDVPLSTHQLAEVFEIPYDLSEMQAMNAELGEFIY